MAASGIYVGIDVSKATLDVYIQGEKSTFVVENNDDGVDQLTERLSQRQVALVAFESTGKLHQLLHASLVEAGIPAHLANAQRVKSFAEAKGKRSKTDAQDARLICAYAEFVKEPTTPVGADMQPLRDLMQRRRQLKRTMASEKQRRIGATAFVKESIDDVIEFLKRKTKELELLVQEEMKKHAGRRVELLRSIPCVGVTTTAALVCWLPELGHADTKKLVGLVGLAPFAQDSGQKFGRRSIRGGRERVRTALYMSALSASHHNPVFSAFYRRLVAAGTPKRAAILAVARKMLCVMNAIIKTDSAWRAVAGDAALR